MLNYGVYAIKRDVAMMPRREELIARFSLEEWAVYFAKKMQKDYGSKFVTFEVRKV